MAMQALRSIEVGSPLGEDVLLFRRMTAVERIGQMFEYHLDLLSPDDAIALGDILGQNVTVRLDLPEGDPRFFNGFVSRFTQLGRHGNHNAYQATLRPWLWFLTRTSDCRIYQEMSVPDIVKDVFRENGFTDIRDDLTHSYRTWKYLVQYRETDFNFISRLLEQEGIYYYFIHENGKHTLVLTDGTHETIPGYEEVPFFPPDEHDRRERDHIHDLKLQRDLQPGSYVHRDYCFQKPSANLEVMRSNPQESAYSEGEMYDYPGEYHEPGDGEHYVQVRLEELHAQFEHVRCEGNVRGLSTGFLFSLTEFPRDDQNREYLVTSAVYEVQSNAYETGGDQEQHFSMSFTAMDSKVQFRPPRITPKPIVQGPQTAKVVGPGGEEIYTDEHGRVKVQFHWDRYGTYDENSSCWLRCSTTWAGKGWGQLSIPRIDQEVIVSFLEGDPDRPMITGRVYNSEQTPPHGMPGGKNLSGMKSNSTKGGGGYNEYVFDDTKGNELIREHGQFDKDSTIENDLREHVLNDRSRDVSNNETIQIGNDRSETVGHDETLTVANNRTETVGVDETLTVGSNRTRTVGSNETVTVAMMRMHTVGINETIAIGAAQQIGVGGLQSIEIGAAQDISVGLAQSIDVGMNQSISVGKDQTTEVGKNRNTDVGENDNLKVGKDVVIDAGDSITLKTGKAKLIMKKDGTIQLEGKDITVKGSGKITAKASKDMILKGKKILQN